MGFFDIFKKKQDSAAADIPESRQQQQEELNAGLEKTKTGIFSKLARAVAGRSTVDADLLDDVEEVLDFYFKACSISVTSQDLAVIGSVLSSHGTLPDSEERVFDREYGNYVNAILMTCGMYDGSGAFAVNVGVPAKSGVGGGIMAVVPTRMGIGIFSPGLDEKGNSLAGIQLLERLSNRLYLSIF